MPSILHLDGRVNQEQTKVCTTLQPSIGHGPIEVEPFGIEDANPSFSFKEPLFRDQFIAVNAECIGINTVD